MSSEVIRGKRARYMLQLPVKSLVGKSRDEEGNQARSGRGNEAKHSLKRAVSAMANSANQSGGRCTTHKSQQTTREHSQNVRMRNCKWGRSIRMHASPL